MNYSKEAKKLTFRRGSEVSQENVLHVVWSACCRLRSESRVQGFGVTFRIPKTRVLYYICNLGFRPGA